MFGGEFRRPLAALDRCTLNKGAFAFKIVRGALKWPLKGGSRLIEVAATAGLTVFTKYILNKMRAKLYIYFRLNITDCIFGNIRENSIFARSVKDIFATL